MIFVLFTINLQDRIDRGFTGGWVKLREVTLCCRNIIRSYVAHNEIFACEFRLVSVISYL